MRLMTTAFADGQRIPAEFAFCAVDPQTHVRLSDNANPDFAWSELPPETKSLALICSDPDVPSRGDDVNKEGRTVPATLPRVDFYHWVLIDLPPDTLPIGRGEFSRGVTARGKPGPAAPRGARQGLNDYTGWFAGDRDMAGNYFGYDGPCPPWNDALRHRYVFTLYALDEPRLAVHGTFSGGDVVAALKGHVLALDAVTGVYTLNPAVRI
jgi:Raf kinase inhibitor-like YbhB/YbcL family protein